MNKHKHILKLLHRFSWASSVSCICPNSGSKTEQAYKF